MNSQKCMFTGIFLSFVLFFCITSNALDYFVTNTISSIFANDDYSGRCSPDCIVRIIGARNGMFSGRLILTSSFATKGEVVKVSDLKMKSGQGGIPASAVRIRYARPNGSEGKKSGRFDALQDEPLTESKVHDIWITVSIPANAMAGEYEGTITTGNIKVPLQVKVYGWQLPLPYNFATHTALIQSPESVALKYNDEMWSEKHLQHIGKTFELLAHLGNRILFVPVVCHTHYGNSEGMVRWICTSKSSPPVPPAGGDRVSTNVPSENIWQSSDSYSYDFTPFEKYLDLYIKKVGKPQFITFYVWTHALGGGYFGKEGKAPVGPLVNLITDTKSRKIELLRGPVYGTPESKIFWKPVLEGLHERMKQRGISDDAFLVGVAGDVRPNKAVTDTLKELAPYARWHLHSHGNARKINDVPVGYVSHVWGVGKDPNKGGAHYGWQVKTGQVVTVFPRYGGGGAITEPIFPNKPLGVFRILGETCLIHGIRGFGGAGADFWPVIPSGDKKGSLRDILNRYPEDNRAQLSIGNATSALLAPGPDGAIATVRFENVREGLQECEARVLIEKALLDQTLRSKLGEELVTQCATVLTERTNAILDAFKRGKESKGWKWFAEGWQERLEKLFRLAEDVARATGTK